MNTFPEWAYGISIQISYPHLETPDCDICDICGEFYWLDEDHLCNKKQSNKTTYLEASWI